jgi:hypothetical protein
MKGLTGKSIGRAATFAAALGLTFGTAVSARTTGDVREAELAPALERVESFSLLGRPHSWRAVDEDTVIVWATASRPYLVELAFPSYDLDFIHVIGVTSIGSRVYAKFDSVRIGGFNYPIDSIYKMTREEAKNWSRQS